MPDSVSGPEVENAFAGARTPARCTVLVEGGAVEIACPFPSSQDWRGPVDLFLLVDRSLHPRAPLSPGRKPSLAAYSSQIREAVMMPLMSGGAVRGIAMYPVVYWGGVTLFVVWSVFSALSAFQVF